MKATLWSMGLALIVIVITTYYVHGGSLPTSLPPQPFQLAEPPSSSIPLIQAPLLEEPFHPSAPTSSSVVAVSDTAYDAMSLKQRSDFLRGIQQTVRQELQSARQWEHPDRVSDQESCDGEAPAPSEHQGRHYKKRSSSSSQEDTSEEEYRCPKNPDGSCPPVPDMTQYIRKDQIPCWGCSIDY